MLSVLKQIGKHPLFHYAFIGLVLFGILDWIYEPITLGLDAQDISILAIPTILGLCIFQYCMGTHILRRAFLGHALAGLLWALTFPLLFHWSYTKPFYFYEFANDFLFGLILFMSLSALHNLLTIPRKWTKLISLIFALINPIICFIPFIQIAYYCTTWHCLTPASLLAIYMTNPEEAFGFVKNAAGVPGLVGVGIFFVIWILICFWANLGMKKIVDAKPSQPLHRGVLILALIASCIYLPFFLWPKTCIIHNWNDVKEYVQEMQEYNSKHQEIFDSFKLSTNATAAQETPGTIILVIGESSSRNYMKIYNHNFPYDDTPWQEQMAGDNKDFILFQNAYSSYVQTVPTLERALTERNQYDDRPFLDSANILDVAKKAGYATTWISNQGVFGQYDTAISLVAKTADQAKWAHESYEFSDRYDEAVLPLLQSVDPKKSNFVVVHIMGSHIYYNDRYPHEFSKWQKGPYPDGAEAYANSQLYTDYLLSKIYQYGKDNLNLQAMVYFSDHGESLNKSHNPDTFDFDMTRIPLWVYLSPTYINKYPDTYKVLESRKQSYWTNDLLYDLLIGIMHAPSDRYDPSRDFSNPAYRFKPEDLTTLLGDQKIVWDPLYQTGQYAPIN